MAEENRGGLAGFLDMYATRSCPGCTVRFSDIVAAFEPGRVSASVRTRREYNQLLMDLISFA